MSEDAKLTELSKDEAGKLHGGFSIQTAKVNPDLWTSNGNCLGGGWGDTNTNCTGTCKSCSISKNSDKEIERFNS
jgi:hypothetical protein